jgi:hypothetical protein
MSIVNPLTSANLFVQPPATQVTTTEERQLDLRLEQMVRATVVDGGLDKPLLELNHRHYRAQSDIELQVGQKLTLQVLQTHPTLELRVINDPLGGRLSQLLPLMTQAYDWTKLLDGLRQHPQQQNLPAATPQIYQQLQQLLQPNGRLPEMLENNLDKLPVQLQQLYLAVASSQSGGPPASTVSGQQPFIYYQGSGTASLPDLPQLIQTLQGQLAQLHNAAGRPLPQEWVADTRQLLAPLLQNLPQLQQTQLLPQQPQLNNLFALLGQMRQQPSLPPQFAGELERLVLQMTVQRGQEAPVPAGRSTAQVPAPPVSPPAVAPPGGQVSQAAPNIASQNGNAVVLHGGVYRPPVATVQVTPPAQPAAVVPAEVSEGLEKLLVQVQQAQGPTGRLSPELLGRLEGLLDKLQQLPQTTQPLLPGLELITSQLTQLVQQGPQLPEGGQLGFLSQLFGFHLEAELLKGKKKEALGSLKMSLLSMQKELGEEVKEPLQRLEMLQLCKARLAEEQVQFLPLPFNELEEGYLLMEKPAQADDDESDPPTQLSLSLRVSALGNMRIDMLYDEQGLHLRVACEDKEKMEYLQEHSAELEESIETVPLQGVSFSADAQVPVRQLLERLLPDALGMLDARI